MANTIEIIGSWPSGETEYVIGTENPSKLPPVSDADNGDVLTVVNGAWKDAAPTGGGGGDIFRVSFGWDEATETDTADKTYAEVITAISAGKTVIGIDDYEGEVINFELISHSGAGVVFRGINLQSPWRTPPILAFSEYSISSADIVTSDYREYTLTPNDSNS